MTWQPDPADGAGMQPAWPDLSAQLPGQWHRSASHADAGPQAARVIATPDQGCLGESEPPKPRRRWRSAAMAMLLTVGLGGLAAAAVGVAHQVLPRQFTTRQQRQIMAWEMARRWRALPAGVLFPDSLAYKIDPLEGSQALGVYARRLGIARRASCGSEVSVAAARVLTARHCSALLRATYLDSSGSMIVTVGIAVLPDSSAAAAAAAELSSAGHGLSFASFAVRALAVGGTPASGFTDRQRQLSWATAAGPYVIMSTAGFTDGRRHVPMATDLYYNQEMTSLTVGLAQATSALMGAQPKVPTCPGAPGC